MKKDNKQRLFEVMERINPDFQLRKPKLILPVGISGSGKSTWIKSQTDPNTIVVSPDDIRRELTGSISDQRKNGEVWSTAFNKVVNALNAGKNVILDATNINSGDRKRLMNHLKVNVDKPFDAFAKIFNVDPEIAKQRVRKDIEAGVDRSNVPDFVIDRQYQNFIDGVNTLETDGFKIMDEEVVRSMNSDTPELDLSKKYVNDRGMKPNGLWYEIDNDWVRFCAMGNVEWIRKYDITIDIDFSNILILDTYEKAIEFRNKYKVPMKQYAHISDPDFLEFTYHLNWGAVAKQYKGIEIPNIGKVKQGDISADDWLWSWDVDSGCIWDLSAIKNHKVVDCEMYKKRDKLMADRD